MSDNKKRKLEVENEAPEIPETPSGLPGGISEMLDRIIAPKKKMTLSECIVRLARDRDILFDVINHWKGRLDEAVACEVANGTPEEADFIREYIAALSAAKDVLTRRITGLLAQT